MEHILDLTGLGYFWGKIKSLFATGTAGRTAAIPFGKVDSTSTATAFTATVEGITELKNGTCVYLMNGVVTSAAATTNPKCWTLNINNLGAKPVYVTTAAATYSTTHFTKNYKMLFTYDESLNSGNGGWYIGQLFNSNTTYSDMTQAEITAGTGTTGRKITPKMLRDNFYTEDEVDSLLGSKANSNDLATVATSGSYNDLDDTPTIPSAVTESTVSGWGFTKNTGTYSKPSGGIPKTDLADAVQTSLGKADTALQSFTETDPTVPAWAKAASKPSYTAAEVGALPDSTTIPSASTATPQMDGTGAAGSASTYAKGDHVHPTDTTREARVTTVNHGTSDTTFALTPNVLHTWGTVNSLTLTLASGSSTYVDGYWFKFTAGSSFSALTLPTGVVWAAEPEIEAGKTYEVFIVNNLATYITEGIEAMYATKQWVTENIQVPSISIVAASGNTLTASVNTVYTYSSVVTTLAITLPAISDSTKAEAISFILTTGTSPNITFSSANSDTILYHDGYGFEDSTMYEINAMFVGSSWIIGMCEITTS